MAIIRKKIIEVPFFEEDIDNHSVAKKSKFNINWKQFKKYFELSRKSRGTELSKEGFFGEKSAKTVHMASALFFLGLSFFGIPLFFHFSHSFGYLSIFSYGLSVTFLLSAIFLAFKNTNLNVQHDLSSQDYLSKYLSSNPQDMKEIKHELFNDEKKSLWMEILHWYANVTQESHLVFNGKEVPVEHIVDEVQKSYASDSSIIFFLSALSKSDQVFLNKLIGLSHE